jgi:putative toxin-antitoxin system antitoxin component (TIGR02293 family)
LKMARSENRDENVILESVPKSINDSEILNLLYHNDINWQYLNALKTYTDFKDDTISDWLNISVKTFREYKKPQSSFKENVKEQVLLLLSLIRHGVDVFGSVKEFDLWLNQENFYFDNKAPISYMNTITGIRFIDDRLTALEYGDNV